LGVIRIQTPDLNRIRLGGGLRSSIYLAPALEAFVAANDVTFNVCILYSNSYANVAYTQTSILWLDIFVFSLCLFPKKMTAQRREI